MAVGRSRREESSLAAVGGPRARAREQVREGGMSRLASRRQTKISVEA